MTETLRRILVTGASGFVGGHLLPRLAAAYPGAEVLTPEFDVRDRAAVLAAIGESQADVCVHLAGQAAVAAAQQDSDSAWQVNLHGTLHVAQAILQCLPQCRLVHISSADAYGSSFRDGAQLSEDAPLAPMNTYGATKAAADLALGSMVGQGLRVIRLRPVNHTGPGQTPSFVVPAFARQVARIAAGLQEPRLEVGNIETLRDFLDVRDVCAAYCACAGSGDSLKPGTILNIASGQPRRIRDILTALLQLAGITADIQIDQSRVRADDLPVTAVDASRAHDLLQWEPAIAWEQTLQDVLNDWRTRIFSEQQGQS
ncbi:MAG TPA: GDP-mannose 4,6-dehydratase [Acetobacteraceae bacterium]|jgi:GDP-4-dehydro-6-deoxy-D-mannose reductase|nr:GDP-mannose 4,6-dehydratase [Acetobacteraceae bacterium]